MVNILIVDDDSHYCEELSTYLKNKEHIGHVYCASSAEESDTILSKSDIDIILLDIGMPSVDGLTYMEQLNSRKIGRPNVIFISNMKNEYIIKRAFVLGCSYYLCKPISYEYAYSIIISFLNNAIQNDTQSPLYQLLTSYNFNSDSIGFSFVCQSVELLLSAPNLGSANIDSITDILSLKNNQNSYYIKWHLYKSFDLILNNKSLFDKLKISKDIRHYNALYNLLVEYSKKIG